LIFIPQNFLKFECVKIAWILIIKKALFLLNLYYSFTLILMHQSQFRNTPSENHNHDAKIYILWTHHSSKQSRDDVAKILSENDFDMILEEWLDYSKAKMIDWIRSPFILLFLHFWKLWSEFWLLNEIANNKWTLIHSWDMDISDTIAYDSRWYDYLLFLLLLSIFYSCIFSSEINYSNWNFPLTLFAISVIVFLIFMKTYWIYTKIAFKNLFILILFGSIFVYLWIFVEIFSVFIWLSFPTFRIIFSSIKTRDNHLSYILNEQIEKWYKKILVVCWSEHVPPIEKRFSNTKRWEWQSFRVQ